MTELKTLEDLVDILHTERKYLGSSPDIIEAYNNLLRREVGKWIKFYQEAGKVEAFSALSYIFNINLEKELEVKK